MSVQKSRKRGFRVKTRFRIKGLCDFLTGSFNFFSSNLGFVWLHFIVESKIFSLYFSPVEVVINSHNLDCMIYANDTQLYLRIQSGEDRATPLAKLELCIRDVIIWCANNALICNPGKTEFVRFSSRFTKTEVLQGIEVNGTVVQSVNSVRNLGLVLDRHLNFSYVNNICKSASLSIRNIDRIRKYLNLILKD